MKATRCYHEREWVTVSLPPEAARGLEVARDRTRSLVHDLAGKPIEDMLVAAYLQGVFDGTVIGELCPTCGGRPTPGSGGCSDEWHKTHHGDAL